jgi:hypothetical protein
MDAQRELALASEHQCETSCSTELEENDSRTAYHQPGAVYHRHGHFVAFHEVAEHMQGEELTKVRQGG